MSLRPVVSSINSLPSVFSTWLDYKMKELLPHVGSYIKNSTTIIDDLKNLKLEPEARLFTADATSMYTNIDTTTGVNAIRDFIHSNANNISPDFPSDLFLQILTLIMNNNIFSFTDTYWLQLSGTAMGTPVACAYATISFGQYENTHILPAFQQNLLYYRRYIDEFFWYLDPLYKRWACYLEQL